MKKTLLSFGAALFTILAMAQTPCPSTFEVLNNGGGGACSNNFPGNGIQDADNSYARSGLIEIRFASAVGSNVTPVITAIRQITSPVGEPVVTGTNLDLRVSLRQFVTGTNRMVAEYCFFSPNNQNLNNASGSRYQVDVTYVAVSGNTASTCNIDQSNEESPLAVHFKSFTAKRSNASAVSLSWITASEDNCKGFYVQKSTGSSWKTVGFVATQAQGGNSVTDLSYSYIDANTDKGVSQYRLQQVDVDGKIFYSDIRAIRGEGLGKVIMYPNPGINGKVNVLLEDSKTGMNVEVTDMQGRVIRSYTNIAENLLVIEDLKPGFYALKITDRTAAVSSVQKLIMR